MEQIQQFLPFILMFVVIYFFMIRPQQKKIKQGNYHYDKETGTIIQKALNQKKTRLIITQIDEEDENLQLP